MQRTLRTLRDARADHLFDDLARRILTQLLEHGALPHNRVSDILRAVLVPPEVEGVAEVIADPVVQTLQSLYGTLGLSQDEEPYDHQDVLGDVDEPGQGHHVQEYLEHEHALYPIDRGYPLAKCEEM